MSNYTKTVDFAAKDALSSGNAQKLIKGTEIDTEYNNVETAIATKADSASPSFSGTTSIVTLSVSGNATIVGTLAAGSIDGGTY